MATMGLGAFQNVDESTYRRRVRAWVLYDWANSAFVTTVLAAVLPVYYSSVAGATLPSEATATQYWSLTLSISLLIVAILSPILGTISDVIRGKKRLLAVFVGLGVIGAGLLTLVSTGDWLMASLIFVLGRIGLGGSIIFYDALLPHVARDDDQDRVSTLGYAMGYLGGGLLLAVNVAMIQLIPETVFENAGIRLSFLTVALWWAVFSLPLFFAIPEPPADAALKPGESVIGVSLARLVGTFRDLQQYGELFKYLVAFLIYNDAIGTIIGLAAIYGAELGFETTELILALLLVQFVGIPFSLIFGRLPKGQAAADTRRPYYLAFIVFNAVMLPVTAITLANVLPPNVSGVIPDPNETTATHLGEGLYRVSDAAILRDDNWTLETISGEDLAGEGFFAALAGTPPDVTYALTDAADAAISLPINGQQVAITYVSGPDRGIWGVLVDGQPLMIESEDDEAPQTFTVDAYGETLRYGETVIITLDEPGAQTLSLINTGAANPASAGTVMGVASVEVLPPLRSSSLPTIMGALLALQAVGLVFALIFGRFFRGLADTLDTRRSILLALVVYGMIATWGFFLNATVEFWFLAWMVAIVQGGSQGLSRSLYASMTPKSKSGEFFGLYSIMEKFASVIGPLIFALAVAVFGSSRPAILSLIVLFVIGGYLLTRVDIERGQRAAREEDREVFGTAEI